MNDLKIGDKVKINVTNAYNLNNGKLGIITDKLTGTPDIFSVKLEDGKEIDMWEHHLEKIEDSSDENKSNNIEHPKHYNQGKIECWNYIIDHKMDFLTGNVCKYITRFADKNGIEDLYKAREYLNKLIGVLENEKK